MGWTVHVRKKAGKGLARIPHGDRERIIQALRELQQDPYAGDIEKIGGEPHTWRRRLGNYRVLYELDIERKVVAVRDIRRRTSSTY